MKEDSMPNTNLVTVSLFSEFTQSLFYELIALAAYLNESNDDDYINIIDRAYSFDFSLFKPKKKITKKQYRDLLTIYASCWMSAFQEHYSNLFSNDKIKNADQTIMETIFFYNFFMGNNPNLDKEDVELLQRNVHKIFKEYAGGDIIPYMRVLADISIKGELKAGATIIRVLHYFMDFEKLI
jgi:hypothetical protein